jgi:hypothetical protein
MHYSALASNLSTRLYAIDSIDIIERCCCAIEYRIDTHSLRALLYMYISPELRNAHHALYADDADGCGLILTVPIINGLDRRIADMFDYVWLNQICFSVCLSECIEFCFFALFGLIRFSFF